MYDLFIHQNGFIRKTPCTPVFIINGKRCTKWVIAFKKMLFLLWSHFGVAIFHLIIFLLLFQFSNFLLQSYITQYRWIKSPIFATLVLVQVKLSFFLLRLRSTMLLHFCLSYLLCKLVCFWKNLKNRRDLNCWLLGGHETTATPSSYFYCSLHTLFVTTIFFSGSALRQ